MQPTIGILADACACVLASFQQCKCAEYLLQHFFAQVRIPIVTQKAVTSGGRPPDQPARGVTTDRQTTGGGIRGAFHERIHPLLSISSAWSRKNQPHRPHVAMSPVWSHFVRGIRRQRQLAALSLTSCTLPLTSTRMLVVPAGGWIPQDTYAHCLSSSSVVRCVVPARHLPASEQKIAMRSPIATFAHVGPAAMSTVPSLLARSCFGSCSCIATVSVPISDIDLSCASSSASRSTTSDLD